MKFPKKVESRKRIYTLGGRTQMGQHKRQYTKEFKLEAIRLYENGDKSVRQVEQDLGITAGLLNKWRGKHQSDGSQAFVGTGHQTELESEVRRLRRGEEGVREGGGNFKKKLGGVEKEGGG